MSRMQLWLILAAVGFMISYPAVTLSDTEFLTYELQACLLSCKNAYDPTFNLGKFRDCVEECVRKYVPPDLL